MRERTRRPRFPKLGVTAGAPELLGRKGGALGAVEVWQFDRIVEAFLPDVHAAVGLASLDSCRAGSAMKACYLQRLKGP